MYLCPLSNYIWSEFFEELYNVVLVEIQYIKIFLFIFLITHSLMLPINQSLVVSHYLTHPPTSDTPSLTDSFTHSLTHSLTHLLTHSITFLINKSLDLYLTTSTIIYCLRTFSLSDILSPLHSLYLSPLHSLDLSSLVGVSPS